MANIYVEAGGSNTSPYDTWAKAATSYATAVALASAGDTIFVHKTFAQSVTSTTYTFPTNAGVNPCKVLCVDKDASDALSTGARIYANNVSGVNIILTGDVWMYGMQFEPSRTMQFGSTANDSHVMTFESCTFKLLSGTTTAGYRKVQLGQGSGQSRPLFIFNSCTFDFATDGNSSSVFEPQLSKARFSNCTISTNTAASGFVQSVSTTAHEWLFEGCDLTSVDPVLVDTQTADAPIFVTFRRCKLPSSWSVAVPTERSTEIIVDACASGTISVPSLGFNRIRQYSGAVSVSLAQYRTGGADDGEQANAHSWEMASNASSRELYDPLISPPVTRWVDAGTSQTLTFYVASGVTLQDDEFWVEVSSPNETTSPNQTTQAKVRTTRINPQTTPSNLTTDSGSTWNGSGVGTKQQITVTISPTVSGRVTVRFCLGRASTTVYVDPNIYLS